MNHNDANKIIDKFLCDPNLIKSTNYLKSVNFFDIFNLKERNYSSFLSWLFDPNESHGLNDLFIKELLKICLLKYKEEPYKFTKTVLKENPFYKDFTIYEIDKDSFTDTEVYTEFKSGKCNGTNGNNKAIDVCLVSENNQLMIFVENKIGASQGPKQRKNYFKYLRNRYSEDYYCVFIYLDYNYEEDKNYCDNPWIFLNYDWISNLLEIILKNKLCNPFAHKIINDIYVDISEELETEEFYYDCQNAMKKLSRSHRDLIELINYKKYKNKLLKTLNFEDTLILKRNNKNKKEEAQLLKLHNIYRNYKDVIDYMSEYTEFDLIGEKLSNELKIDSKLVECDDSYISVTHKFFDDLTEKNNHWPIWVQYSEKRKIIDKNHLNNQYIRKIFIEFDLKAFQGDQEILIRKYISEQNSKLNPRYNKIKVKNFSERPSDDDFVIEFRNRYIELQKIVNMIK